MKLLAFTGLLAVSSAVMPCTVPPLALFRDHAALVSDASTIVLAEAIADTKAVASCQLRVVRTLKGAAPTTLPITCRLPGAGNQ